MNDGVGYMTAVGFEYAELRTGLSLAGQFFTGTAVPEWSSLSLDWAERSPACPAMIKRGPLHSPFAGEVFELCLVRYLDEVRHRANGAIALGVSASPSQARGARMVARQSPRRVMY